MIPFASLFLVLIFSLFGGPDKEKDHQEFQVSSGQRLLINIESGGAISVSGWDKEVVSLDVDRRGRDDDECTVEAQRTGSGVEISSRYEGYRHSSRTELKFIVHVPKSFDLDVETTGGAISIDNVSGKIEGRTMGGALDFTQLKGTLHFETMGGKISLTKSEVDGEVSTNGGSVLLEDVVGNVKGHSMGGKVIYRNVTDRKGLSTGNAVVISTMGGEVNVDDAPYGADLNTMGGEINVKSASQFVKAKTMGGDITIGSVDGWVDAETMGGDVTVTMVGDPSKGRRDVRISSKGGDVTLTVPSGLSMDVDITISRTREWHRRSDERVPKIESDFSLKQEESKDWDDREGSARKYLRGRGTIGDGANKIRIETVNGSVYLRKSS